MVPNLWGMRRITSERYPVVGDLTAHSVAPIIFDVKDYAQTDILDELFLRIRGTIAITGAAPGVATGRENPEALVVSVMGTTKPSLGGISKNNLSARGIIAQRIFDNGYSFRATPIIDDEDDSPFPVDFWLPLRYKMPGSVNPIEWALPMALFDEYSFRINCGGRDQLFVPDAQLWDLTGLQFELWGSLDEGVAGAFHFMEEFEQTYPVTQSQSDFQIRLDSGWIYTHLLFMTERDNVLVNDILGNVNIQSGGRIWLPQGDDNALTIQRWNRETHVNNAAEDLTGLYFIPALRDGMYRRGIDALQDKVEVKLGVTRTSGSELVTVRGRRIKPLALQVA